LCSAVRCGSFSLGRRPPSGCRTSPRAQRRVAGEPRAPFVAGLHVLDRVCHGGGEAEPLWSAACRTTAPYFAATRSPGFQQIVGVRRSTRCHGGAPRLGSGRCAVQRSAPVSAAEPGGRWAPATARQPVTPGRFPGSRPSSRGPRTVPRKEAAKPGGRWTPATARQPVTPGKFPGRRPSSRGPRTVPRKGPLVRSRGAGHHVRSCPEGARPRSLVRDKACKAHQQVPRK
jgi:hypothetical protein